MRSAPEIEEYLMTIVRGIDFRPAAFNPNRVYGWQYERGPITGFSGLTFEMWVYVGGTHKELAEKLGVSKGFIVSIWEHNKSIPFYKLVKEWHAFIMPPELLLIWPEATFDEECARWLAQEENSNWAKDWSWIKTEFPIYGENMDREFRVCLREFVEFYYRKYPVLDKKTKLKNWVRKVADTERKKFIERANRNNKELPVLDIQCPEDIIPLKNSSELVMEGSKMNHCVANYVPKCLNGEAYIYHLNRGEHGDTIRVIKEGNKLVVVEHLSHSNRTPVQENIEYVKNWIEGNNGIYRT